MTLKKICGIGSIGAIYILNVRLYVGSIPHPNINASLGGTKVNINIIINNDNNKPYL
jgi:hypothetical protein